jgi:hypothetical protein
MAYLILALAIVCTDEGDEARAAIAIAQAQAHVKPIVKEAPIDEGSYTRATKTAQKEGKPLVVFVGCKERPIQGCVTVGTTRLSDGTTSNIVVSRNGKEGDWLKCSATDQEIRIAAGLEVRASSQEPFRVFQQQQASTVCRT